MTTEISFFLSFHWPCQPFRSARYSTLLHHYQQEPCRAIIGSRCSLNNLETKFIVNGAAMVPERWQGKSERYWLNSAWVGRTYYWNPVQVRIAMTFRTASLSQHLREVNLHTFLAKFKTSFKKHPFSTSPLDGKGGEEETEDRTLFI